MKVLFRERDMARFGFQLLDREAIFVDEHPDWRGRTQRLLATYLTCQGERVEREPIEFEAALQHANGCGWCARQLHRS